MSMLDISALTSSAAVELNKVGIKAAGSEGGGLEMDVDLVVAVEDEDQAEVIQKLIPGALDLWRKARVGQKAREDETRTGGAAAGSEAGAASGQYGENKTVPPSPDVHLTLRKPDGDQKDGEVGRLLDRDGEVRLLRIKSTPKATTLLVRARLYAVSPEDVALLVPYLGKTVNAFTEQRQGVLPFRKRVTVDKGDVVSGVHEGVEYAGVVLDKSTDDDGENFEVQDVLGEPTVVPAITVSGAFKIHGGATSALIDRYEAAAKKKKSEASWLHLVVALGTAHAKDATVKHDDGSFIVSDAVIDAAVALGKAPAKTANA